MLKLSPLFQLWAKDYNAKHVKILAFEIIFQETV